MGARAAIDFESARDGELTIRSNGYPRKTFKFDAVFSPQADQGSLTYNYHIEFISIVYDY